MKVSWVVSLMCACTASPESTPPRTSTRSNEPEMTTTERNAVALLKWVDTADPVADAKRAVAEKRPVLLILGGRGAPAPGVSPELRSSLSAKCPVQVLPGATDTVHGNTHLNYLQRARDYAEKYNRELLPFCPP